jgi:hypothetical protein
MKKIILKYLFFIIYILGSFFLYAKTIEYKDYSNIGLNLKYRQGAYNMMVKSVSEDNLIRFYVKRLSLDLTELVKNQQKLVNDFKNNISSNEQMNSLIQFRYLITRIEFLMEEYRQFNPVLRDLKYNKDRLKANERLNSQIEKIKKRVDVVKQHYETYQQKYFDNLPKTIRSEIILPILQKEWEKRRKNYCLQMPRSLFLRLAAAKFFYIQLKGKPYDFILNKNNVLKTEEERAFLLSYCKDIKDFKIPDRYYTNLKAVEESIKKYNVYSSEFQTSYKQACSQVTDLDLIQGCKINNVSENFLYSLSFPSEYKEVKGAN